HRLTQKNDKYSIDTNEIIENAVFIKKENACIPITNREDTLLNLCYHMFQHEYRETRYQLKCHSDIFNFLYYYRKELNWVCFWDNVRKNNLEFPVSYALYHVNLLYENVLGMNIVPVEILEKIVTDNFKEKKDWVISRHLLNNDEPIGIWEQSYLERLFMDTKTVRTELCKIHFFYSCRKEWEKECEKMKISFEEGFKFTPEAWKALGRI
ncbi:MAG: nucleotidyltransferase family protein, partial [Lachnospiraceae bacterium]|nr:nucleotidyltransferase family protein [Lachnospiraceae bacterium]